MGVHNAEMSGEAGPKKYRGTASEKYELPCERGQETRLVHDGPKVDGIPDQRGDAVHLDLAGVPVRQDRIEVSGYPTEAVCREGGPHASPHASFAGQPASGHPKRRMEPLDGPFL
jgi:hypothetical protein